MLTLSRLFPFENTRIFGATSIPRGCSKAILIFSSRSIKRLRTQCHHFPDHDGRSLRRSFPMSLRRRSADTSLTRKVARKLARKWHVGIFKNPSKTRKLARKTHSFFSQDPNVNSPSAQLLAVSLNPEISQPIAAPLSFDLRTGSISSPEGEDQDEGGLQSFCTPVAICKDSKIINAHQPLDFPTQNQFPKLNIASRSAVPLICMKKSGISRLSAKVPHSPMSKISVNIFVIYKHLIL